MKLSKNFSLQEFQYSYTADSNGIDNTVPAYLYSNLKTLAERLQLIRDAINLPITISSGYRSPELNKLVGGAATSQHQLGLAADIVCSGLSAQALYEVIVDLGISFDQLIIEKAGGKEWVHISVQPAERNEKMRYDGDNYTKG